MPRKRLERSTDDALEASRTGKTPFRVGQQALPDDYEPPATPAKNPYIPPIPPDDPSTDSDLDSAEVYDESEEGAAPTPENPDVSQRNTGVPKGKE